MAIEKKQVIDALGTVQDPDLKKDLVTLGMIQELEVGDNGVSFTVMLTTPACPLKEIIRKDCEQAVRKVIGETLPLDIFMSSSVTTARKDNTPLLPGVKNIVAVASGKGGVGKSTVTANLAISLTQIGAKVGIIDADIFGPSMPTMFNCVYEKPNLRRVGEKDILEPVEQYGVKIMSIGFLAPPESAVVWRGPMASSALRQFITDTDWGELDYLLIDLPPGTSDIHLTMVQTVPLTGAVIVTTPQQVALADAEKGLGMFKQPQINVPLLGLIENMSWFTPEELPDNKYYLFGKDGGKKLAEKHGIPMLGCLPLVQGIRESGDEGLPAAFKEDISKPAFDALAKNLAQQVAIKNATGEKAAIVGVKS